jgi:hypothetical protein
MDDGIDSGSGGHNASAVGDVAAEAAHSESGEFGIVAAAKACDLVTAGHKLAHDRLAEKSTAARD